MDPPTVSREGPASPPSPPHTIRLRDAFVNHFPEVQGDENVHWKPMREPALLKHPEIEPALPTASLRPVSLPPSAARSAMPSLAVEPIATRSALAPRTDAQANHTREQRNNTGTIRKEEARNGVEAALAMPGVDVRRSIGDEPRDSSGRVGPGSMTPPRSKPSGDTIGSISDLVKMSRSFEQQLNVIPRNPKDSTSPKRRTVGRHIQATTEPPREISAADKSIQSQKSSGSGFAPLSPSVWQWVEPADPESQEQALFEQRLCEDVYGVAVRKINQNGKSTLRYVKCVPIDDGSCADDHQSSSKSVSSLVKSLSRRSVSERQRERALEGEAPGTVDLESHRNLIPLALTSRKKALAWGKKKDVRLNVERFVCVRKGKTTERTIRNTQPASRLLSLISDDPNNPSLDIEAPTKLDRDKFARAFSKFLGVPLIGDDDDAEEYQSASADFSPNHGMIGKLKLDSYAQSTGSYLHSNSPKHISLIALDSLRNSASRSVPDVDVASKRTSRTDNAVVMSATPSVDEHLEIRFDAFPSEPEKPPEAKAATNSTSLLMMAAQSAAIIAATDEQEEQEAKNKTTPVPTESLNITGSAPTSTPKEKGDADEGSVVSSLTGAGFDQEIVEELHQALTDLRAELEGSRAEAARAVKVAEQAIQSAENSSSKDWNNTVTHKAAEAAALAQKKSAEAMAKQRLAEERLAAERRSAAFWRKQAEAAEEDAGVLQTRAAAAEVQRAAMAEELESERRKAAALVASVKQRYSSSEVHQSSALDSAQETNRSLLIELDSTRRELDAKSEEAKILQEALEEA